MEESFYHKEADIELSKLLEFAERLEEVSDTEAELESGVLTITLPGKKQYVINKHAPSRQIWVSSPLTGAGYYEFKDGNWLPKRTSDNLHAPLQDFLKAEIAIFIK